MKWNLLSVAEPTCAAFYLVYVGGNYNRIHYAWWDMYWHRFDCGAQPVTHWMPEPAPPTAEERGASANSTQQAAVSPLPQADGGGPKFMDLTNASVFPRGMLG
jgi:hypothetical protein